MTFLQTLIIAIIQGATELFPVSSLGHAVVVPAIFGWIIDRHNEVYLPFLVFLHCGTALALLIYFWRDWQAIISSALGFNGEQHQKEGRYILLLLAVATVPAVLVGAVFEKTLRILFSTPDIVAFFLIINGCILLLTEKLKSKDFSAQNNPIARMTLLDAFIIGCWQCAAFFPGISRSGSTIVGGLFRGLNHETSARFSFLLALPIILAATAHQGVRLFYIHVPPQQYGYALVGAVVAAITALISMAILMRYFRDHERWALTPFGVYCMGLGLFTLLLDYYFY